MTTSYWLAESREPLPTARASGPVDVVVVGGGVTGCSCALTPRRARAARPRARGPRGRRRRERPERRLRPPRRCDELRRVPRGAGRGARAGPLAAVGARARRDGRARRRRAPARRAACASPSDDAERAELEAELEALRDDGFAAEWLDPLPAPLDRLFRGALLHPRDGAIHPARWVRRLAAHAVEAGAEIVEQQPRRRSTRSTPRPSSSPSTGSTRGLLPELERPVVPVRGQMLATAPLAERAVRAAALRPPRLRLLAAAARRPARRRRQARRRASRPSTPRRGRRRRVDPGASSRRSRPSCVGGAAARHAPLGRHLGRDARRPAARRAGPGPAGRLGRRRLLGHGNVLGFACGGPGRARDRGRASARARALRPRSLRPSSRRVADSAPDAAQLEPPGPSAARRRRSRQSSNDGTSSASARANAAIAIARSWIASPVESKRRDLVGRRASRRLAGEHRAELRHVARASTSPPRPRARARRCGSPAPSRRRRSASARAPTPRSRPCPGPSAPIRLTCWPGPQRALGEQQLVARRHRHEQVGRERLLARRRDRAAELLGRARVRAAASTSQSDDLASAREERPRRRAAVDACADHGRGLAHPGDRASRRRAPPPRPSATPSRRPRRAPPRAVRRRRSRAARARSPSAGRAPGCPGTTSPTSAARARRRAPASRGSRRPGSSSRTASAASSTRRGDARRTRRAPPRPPPPATPRARRVARAKTGTDVKAP